MKKSNGRRIQWIALTLICVALIPLAANAMMQSFFFNEDNPTVTISKEEYDRLQAYQMLELMTNVIDRYFYEEPDTDAMVDYATHAVLFGTTDAKTRYVNEEEQAVIAASNGQEADLGLLLGWEKENYLLRVRYVDPDGPAAKAGILVGDYIASVDDTYLSGFELDYAQALLRGPVDSGVKLKVYRGDPEVPVDEIIQDMELSRAVTQAPPAYAMEVTEEGEAVIGLYTIASDTAEVFAQALAQAQQAGATKLILDLRETDGGSLEALQSLAEMLLPAGRLAVLAEKDGQTEYEQQGTASVLPLTVLIGSHTGGMAEVLTAAVQYTQAGTVMGTNSLGAATEQQFFPLGEEGAGVYITTGAYLDAEGNEIRERGVSPDQDVESAHRTWLSNDMTLSEDTQLQEVLSLVRGA